MYLSEDVRNINSITNHYNYAELFTEINFPVKSSSRHHYIQRSVEFSSLPKCSFMIIKQFVWVDETVSDDRNRRRKFGYCLRGEPPVCHRILHCVRRISVISAMSTSGLVTCS